MLKYFAKRLARSAVTMLIIISAVFLLLRGMPIEGYFANYEKLTEEQIENGLHQMGLDRPVFVQLFGFICGLFRGDLGTSRVYRQNVSVAEILKTKIPVSVKLGCMAQLLSLVCGPALGTLMAQKKGRLADSAGTAFIVLIQAVPAAVYFLFLQLTASEIFHIPLLFNADSAVSWIMPVVSLSLGGTAHYAMWLRAIFSTKPQRIMCCSRAQRVTASGRYFPASFSATP